MVAELLLLLRVMALPAYPEPERDRRQGGLGMEQQKGAVIGSSTGDSWIFYFVPRLRTEILLLCPLSM